MLGLVAIAFVVAEILHPTVWRAKKDALSGLVVSRQTQAAAVRTTFDPELLDDLPRIDGLPLGNIDAVTATSRGRVKPLSLAAGRIVPRGHIDLVGWLADSQSKTPGSAIFPIVDGRRLWDASVWYGYFRPDVGKFYATPALDRTGFLVRLPAKSLPRGADRVQLGLVSSDGRGFFLSPQALSVEVAH